jgi:hypothetical protein
MPQGNKAEVKPRQRTRQNKKPNNRVQKKGNGKAAGQKKVQKKTAVLARENAGENNVGRVTNVINYSTAMAQSNDTLKRNSSISLASVGEFFSAFMSRLITLGVALDPEVNLTQFYEGYKYMIEGALRAVQGNPAPEQFPYIIADWIAALRQKELGFHGFAAVSYGWDEFDTSAGNVVTVTVGTAVWNLQVPQADTALYNSPSTPFVGATNEESYSYFLKVVAGLSQIPILKRLLKTVNMTEHKSVLERDASAFAYSYPYFGLSADQTTAWWNNAESLTNITSPALAKYVPYPQSGPITFTSQKYVPTAGGASQFLTPLADLPISYFNKVPINYKPIDTQDLWARLISWYQGLVLKKGGLTGGAQAVSAYTLNMSLQTFYIIASRMVLRNSPCQFLGQFEGPNTLGTTTNYFQPFMVTASTWPNQFYELMKIPEILAENLAMLQEFSYNFSFRGKSSNNFAQFVPIWGFYPNDLPLNPTISFPDGTTAPMFVAPGPENPIQLSNLSYGGPGNPNFVNVNSSYYEGAVNTWNEKISELQDVSVPIATNNRSRAGTIPYAMFVTKMVNTITTEVPGFESLRNKFYGPRKESKGKLLPPGTPASLHVRGMCSSVPLPKEVAGALNILITPSIRLDETGATILTESQWRTASGELIVINADASLAPTLYVQIEAFGQYCVTGVGRDQNNELQMALELLTGKGKGGALAEILAGALGTILPSGAPVFKTLASLVPI